MPTLAQRGLKRLIAAWQIALRDPAIAIRDPDLAAACDQVFLGTEGGYKKALVVQAAGKAADIALDAQAMQKGEGNPGSWDAREFAKQVFVPWNSQSHHPFAHSADPYVSNPYRVPRFDGSVRGKRKRPAEFDATITVLEHLNSATTPAAAFRNLVEVLQAYRRYIADRTVDYPLPNRASLADTSRCIDHFVSEKSGGTRLQAVVFALFEALQRAGMSYVQLRSRHVNTADASDAGAGDITFQIGSAAVAVEVKDRALDAAELDATIEKCRIAAIKEAVLVIRATKLLAADLSPADFAARRDSEFSSGLNLYLEAFETFYRNVLTILGEAGRRDFLESVGTALVVQNADVTHKWAWAALVKAI